MSPPRQVAYPGGLAALSAGLPGETVWERGQQLQQALIRAMRALEPDRGAANPQALQRYQILWRLYHEGDSRAAIIQDLALSERHYERHLREGIEMLAAQWQGAGNGTD